LPAFPAPIGEDGDALPSGLRVTAVEIYVDPETLDRIFVVHSEEHEPVILCIAAVDLEGYLRQLASVIAKSMN